MRSSIFSTYSTGENRVTASIMAVLRSLSLGRIERLLGALMEKSEFELVQFENQVSDGGDGVPDGLIASSCRIFLETKIKRNAVHADQIRRHLKRLKSARESIRALLVLTPDDQRPKAIDQLRQRPVMWASFSLLDQGIEELLGDKTEVMSEREAFLLRELQAMLLEERLIGSSNEVLIVPGRDAWPEYQSFGAYVCQPNRPFRRVQRMGFYSSGHIHELIPTILQTWNSVRFEHKKEDGWLGELIELLLRRGPRQKGVSYKVIRLSTTEQLPETIRLRAPVRNDLKSESGRPVAFTQSQRYVSLEKLMKAKVTSNLVEQAVTP